MKRKRKANLRRCDSVFSKLVRTVGICEMEGYSGVACAGPLQCAHIVSRSYRSTRWSRENALCICAAHHVFYTHRPLEWEQAVLDHIGPDEYEALKRRALESVRVNYEAVLSSLEAA